MVSSFIFKKNNDFNHDDRDDDDNNKHYRTTYYVAAHLFCLAGPYLGVIRTYPWFCWQRSLQLSLGNHLWCRGLNPGSVLCKANALLAVLSSFWPRNLGREHLTWMNAFCTSPKSRESRFESSIAQIRGSKNRLFKVTCPRPHNYIKTEMCDCEPRGPGVTHHVVLPATATGNYL